MYVVLTPEYKYRIKFSVIYTAAAKQQILQQFACVQHSHEEQLIKKFIWNTVYSFIP